MFSGTGLRRSVENQLREAGVGSVPKKQFDDLCDNLLSSKSEATVHHHHHHHIHFKACFPLPRVGLV